MNPVIDSTNNDSKVDTKTNSEEQKNIKSDGDALKKTEETDKETSKNDNGDEIKNEKLKTDESVKRKASELDDENITNNNDNGTNGKKASDDDEPVKKEAKLEESVDNEDAKSESADSEEPDGTLLICGGCNWDMTGRKELPKGSKKNTDPAARSLWEPHRVVLEDGKNIRVRGVFSGPIACHSVIVLDNGTVMTFGRNGNGQLGLGDTETRFVPTVVEGLKDLNIVSAACGRAHTLFLTDDGTVYACGANKMGQCGTNQPNIPDVMTPSKVIFRDKPVVKMACGAEFSLIIDNEGKLYSFGCPEYGQLGNNTEGKYFTTGNKYAFHCEYMPRRVLNFIEKSREGHILPLDEVFIVDIACGTNHSLAVDKRNRCYSWGFGGYHRLGHSETKNELVPRSIKVFDGPPNSGRGATRVFCGATHSMAIDVNGLLFFWGQNKSSGEATMYPKHVQDLCGWRMREVACANRSIVVVADESCISWGPSPTYGELGYGEGRGKSSTTPLEVKVLEGVHINKVVCGYGHTLFIARDKSKEEQDRLNKMMGWP